MNIKCRTFLGRSWCEISRYHEFRYQQLAIFKDTLAFAIGGRLYTSHSVLAMVPKVPMSQSIELTKTRNVTGRPLDPLLGRPPPLRHFLPRQRRLLAGRNRAPTQVIRIQGSLHLRAPTTTRTRSREEVWHPEEPGLSPRLAQSHARREVHLKRVQNCRRPDCRGQQAASARAAQVGKRAGREADGVFVLFEWDFRASCEFHLRSKLMAKEARN